MRGPTPRRKKEFSDRLSQRARDVEPSHQWPSAQSGEPATNPQSAPRTLPPPQAVPGNIRETFREVVDYDQVQPFPGLAMRRTFENTEKLKRNGSELHVQGK